MFQKVLIANRGEIALRVIRACKELGVATVAVYSEADRECLHVRFADDDVCIGRAPSRDSYLNIPRLIAAAEITGADAIHPGYGFLAENAEFAEKVGASNITFIGPTPDQIRQMGDKATARKIAQKLKVATVPGSPGPVESVEEGLKIAAKLGFPVIIKAAAGGGGKGMRVAADAEQFGQSFNLATQEALAAFGSGEVYLEKYLARPRHIEIQIMGDTHGKVMHLCERDCSVQRRHQKLIEEAPSPAVDQTLREDIGDAAVKLAESIGYVGAGTIEFLLDEDGSFYFMEMNTRIQVEHPVTEMCTNFDLVKEQIRVAASEPLSFVMNGNRLRGHAIECRVNAEDPARNFQPSPGLITAYHPPGGPGVRVDTHIYAGYTVPPYYDSLLAKVIVHGNSRDEALARMRQALDSFIIEGVTTTIPFLGRVMRHADFIAGNVDTKFLEREPHLLKEHGVVVIDVLRAGSTLVTALAAGAKAVVPASSSEEAVRLTANLEKDGIVLAGERRMLKIEGFGLGNSPREMTREAVGGKTVYLATTNGTPALVAVQGGDPVLVAAALNFSAAAERARAVFQKRGDLVIVCAGREKQFALEDAYTAGRLIKAVKKGARKLTLNDAAQVALDLAAQQGGWRDAFAASDAAHQLADAGLGEDVTYCAQPDRVGVVPVYADRRITA